VFAATTARAQTVGAALSGVVTGAGQPFGGAVVLLQGTLLDGIPPGRYTVTASLIGYQSVRRQGDVAPGESRLDLALERAIVEIPGVVVTASPMDERPDDSPASVAVPSHDALRPPVWT
jgi:hypothetical protein